MTKIRHLACLLLLGASTSAAWSEEHDSALTIDQVPAAVKATIEKAAAGATITEIEKQERHGSVVYEAEWQSADGKTETEIKVAEDGTLLKSKQRAGEDDEHDH